MNFRRLLVANFIHYSSDTDLLVSVAESCLTASKDFRFRKHGDSTIHMRIHFLYQEWQGILVPVYLSQQLTNYNAHQFAKQSYRPDEHRYLIFHDILVKFFIH